MARRAQHLLENENPITLDQALAVLAPLSADYPEMVVEGDHPFTECAIFADYLVKGPIDVDFEYSWHFINTPYFDEGVSASDYPDFHLWDTDVIGALDALTKYLSGG